MISANVRKAVEKDIPELEALVNQAYRGDSARKGWTHEADLLGGQRIDQQGLRELIADHVATVLLFIEEGKILGCVCLEKRERRIYLGMLTVVPARQNKGIGKQLLGAAEAFARQAKCNFIEMTVISKRNELIRWYERHGYTNTGQIQPFPSHDPRFGIPVTDLEFVLLEKKLDPLVA